MNKGKNMLMTEVENVNGVKRGGNPDLGDPDLLLLAVFDFLLKARKITNKARISILAESLVLGKSGQTLKKSKEFLERQGTRQFKQAKKRRSDREKG